METISVRPLTDNLVIARTKQRDVSDGGVALPQTAIDDELDEGTVLAVGPEVHNIEAGDTVIFVGYGGTTVLIDGEKRIIISAAQVVARRIE